MEGKTVIRENLFPKESQKLFTILINKRIVTCFPFTRSSLCLVKTKGLLVTTSHWDLIWRDFLIKSVFPERGEGTQRKESDGVNRLKDMNEYFFDLSLRNLTR